MTTKSEVIDQLVAQWSLLYPHVRLLGVDREIPVGTLGRRRHDLVLHIQVGGVRHEIVCEVKSVGEPRYLHQAISALKASTAGREGVSPAVIAPYISEEGRTLCREAGINYVDLAGNILLRFDQILIDSTSSYRPRRRKDGGPYNIFAPISSRVLRVFLEKPRQPWKFTTLSQESQVSLRTAHRVVSVLADKGYVDKRRGAISLVRAGELLDLWAKEYQLGLSAVQTYYSFDRTFAAFGSSLRDLASREAFSYAFTVHAGASLVAPFVRFSDVHFYFRGDVAMLIEGLDLRPVETGGTIHVLKPYDEGIFYNQQEGGGLSVVCDTQLYLDLINYPARGREQAEFLREQKMPY